MGIATLLGAIGVITSFGIFYIGLEVFKLSPEMIQTFIFLKLSVAGHLTVLVARTKRHFWSPPPAKILFLAIVLTQLVATLIAVYGIIITPIGWTFALFVWGYALISFLITDFLKIYLYRLINHSEMKFKR